MSGHSLLGVAALSRSSSSAKVFITSLNPQGTHQDALAGLKRAGDFLRSQLGRRMQLRLVPQLSFVYDESVEHGMHLSQLIDQAIAEDAKNPKDESGIFSGSPLRPRPTMPSADFCMRFPAPLDAGSTRRACRSPRVLHTHLHAYACRIYVVAFRTSIGL